MFEIRLLLVLQLGYRNIQHIHFALNQVDLVIDRDSRAVSTSDLQFEVLYWIDVRRKILNLLFKVFSLSEALRYHFLSDSSRIHHFVLELFHPLVI